MSKMDSIRKLVPELTTAKLRSQCTILSAKLDKIPKGERSETTYIEGVEAWKIMRSAIVSRT